ncbi:hypothetical protein HI914_06371 [Erysiphe necator]|nr:hypothetical protein HI914_06371 [Erysiphe necator]
MRLNSAFIFVSVLLIEVILADKNVNHVGSRPDSTSLSKRKFPSATPKKVSSSHHKKRALFNNGGSSSKLGFTCGKTFYSVSKVKSIKDKACIKARTGYTFRKAISSKAATYTGPNTLFPNETPGTMTMLSLSGSILPKIGLANQDFVIFGGQCRPIGVMRRQQGYFQQCKASPGTNIFEQPYRPTL